MITYFMASLLIGFPLAVTLVTVRSKSPSLTFCLSPFASSKTRPPGSTEMGRRAAVELMTEKTGRLRRGLECHWFLLLDTAVSRRLE